MLQYLRYLIFNGFKSTEIKPKFIYRFLITFETVRQHFLKTFFL